MITNLLPCVPSFATCMPYVQTGYIYSLASVGEENFLEIVMRHWEGNGETIKNGIIWLSFFFFKWYSCYYLCFNGCCMDSCKLLVFFSFFLHDFAESERASDSL